MREMLRVDWVDAHAGEDTWVHVSDIDDIGDYMVCSVGQLLLPGDGGQTGHISLALSIGKDDCVDGIINIPLGMVRSVAILNGETVSIEKIVRR
jgi:hypothetical protein